jgi:aminotransferase
MILSALRDAGITPHVPDGAYYVLASTAGLENVLEGANAAERSRSRLKKTGVAAVAGSSFFRAGRGEDLLRFCFAKKDEDLEEACRRLRGLR